MKISDILNEDATIPELERNIEVGFPDTKKRQHATNEVQVTNLQYTPIPQSNFLRINSNSRSTNNNTHQQIIDLRTIQFDKIDNEQNVSFEARNGTKYFVHPVELSATTVGVFCDCEDYMMRFANFNIQNNCHVGPTPRPYTRKTDNRPPVNPSKVPGMCKHLIKLADQLEQFGLLG
ncbi:MAG: hypothetical protein ACXWFB_12570 [Nitrososphaeraceae archaeon]